MDVVVVVVVVLVVVLVVVVEGSVVVDVVVGASIVEVNALGGMICRGPSLSDHPNMKHVPPPFS